MQLTNNHGLHAGIEHAIRNWYFEKRNPNPKHFRVTELIRPVQQVVLERRHNEEMETDVMNLVNAWRGSAIHEFLSRFDKMNALQEIDLEIEIGGELVKGRPDHYEDETILDFKNCKVWKYVFRDFGDWEEQTNFYALMMKAQGFPVKSLEVVAIFDDWSKMKALAESDYPKTTSVTVPLLLWPDKKIKAVLENRVTRLAKNLRETPDEDLPECTPEEMWADPEKHAVMKVGRKSAVKLHDDAEAAEKHAAELGAKHYVQHRPGKRKRCEAYCSASAFCHQWKKYQAEQAEAEATTEDDNKDEAFALV